MATIYILRTIFLFICILVGTHCDDVTMTSYNNIRLPGNIIPVEYTVYMHPNITDGTFSVSGHVDILFDVVQSTDSIILHSKSHKYFSISVRESPNGREVPIKRRAAKKKYEFLILYLREKLVRGKRYLLNIVFGGVLNTDLVGFYRSSYTNEKGETKYLATTDFEPTGARLAFPCFDEPAMKAKFSIIIVREKMHTALSNMPVERAVLRKDGLVEDHFQKSVTMSTYLVAFIVSDFARLSQRTKRGIEVSVWAPKYLILQAKYATIITRKILDYYEKFFKIDFPLPKLDLIGIPDYPQGAEENWGLITFRLSDLLYDVRHSSSSDMQNIAQVVAHEIAHQWFGDLVTMDWWNDIWLNEGFATYVEFIGADIASPWMRVPEQFITYLVQPALELDSNIHSHPISVPVSDPADINALFDTISYMKGSSIIRMMQDFIGEKRFMNGLTDYLNKHKYGSATSDALWECLTDVTRQEIDVKVVMDTWIKQKGFPVVHVVKDSKRKMAMVTQERFMSDGRGGGGITDSPFNYTWEIPLTYSFQNDRQKQREWFHRDQHSVHIPWNEKSGWMKMNSDQIGFYRVNYDAENWKLLTNQLLTNHKSLSPADRSSLINDAFALANAGLLSHTKALDLTVYLKNEADYIPFSSAVTALNYIEDMLLHRQGYVKYEEYILKQIAPLLKRLGWNDMGNYFERLLRVIILKKAVHHNNTDAVAKATELFKDHMLHHTYIPTNLREVVYMAGVKYGGTNEWNYIFKKYKASKSPSEKMLLMSSLAYSTNQTTLKWYLESTISQTMRAQDTNIVISKIAANPLATRMTRDFIIYNWNLLLERNYFDSSLQAAFGGGKTKPELVMAQNVFTTHAIGRYKFVAKQILSTIQTNVDWLRKNEKEVTDWFSKESYVGISSDENQAKL